ncbi:MAG TPA: hypothetical protein VKE40_06540 [Gemmataceae bacterium]|nr:hypothetical protein [Gemmataceae bacterium]
MRLERVIYELFESEGGAVRRDPAAQCDEVTRQVRLEGAAGERVYISWAWGRGQPDYFLEHAPGSFFTNSPDAELDVTASPVWRPLVRREVIIGYRDNEWQVIEVRAGEAVVYCCSFQMDRVYVMPRLRDGRTIRCT